MGGKWETGGIRVEIEEDHIVQRSATLDLEIVSRIELESKQHSEDHGTGTEGSIRKYCPFVIGALASAGSSLGNHGPM